MPDVLDKLHQKTTCEAVLHQCAHGLNSAMRMEKWGPVKKIPASWATCLLCPELACHCSTQHVQAIGGVHTKDGWKRWSELAGHCSLALCNTYAAIASRV